ncbi:MAG: hypothetical protein ACREGH_04075 [Minisyncoccia bacterium]
MYLDRRSLAGSSGTPPREAQRYGLALGYGFSRFNPVVAVGTLP